MQEPFATYVARTIDQSNPDRLRAVVAAYVQARDVDFRTPDNSAVNFLLLAALVRPSTVSATTLQAGGARASGGRKDYRGGSGQQFVLDAALDKASVPRPFPAMGQWRISEGTEVLAEGEYDFVEEAKRMFVDAAQPAGAKRSAKLHAVADMAVVGYAGMQEAVRNDLPLCKLRLLLKLRFTTAGAVPDIQLRGMQLICQSYSRNVQPQSFAVPLAAVSRMYNVNEPVPRSTPQPTPLPADRYRQLAKLHLEQYCSTSEQHALYMMRDGRPVFAHESDEVKPLALPLGQFSSTFSSVAVFSNFGKLNNTATGAVASDPAASDPARLYDALRATGAQAVGDALRSLYTRAGMPEPSLDNLLLHTSGLPAALQLSTADLNAMVLRADAAADQTAGGSDADLATLFARELSNNAVVLTPPGAAYRYSYLGWAVLLFTLPGWNRTSALRDVFTEMGMSAGTTSGLANTHPGYAGIYSLGTGAHAPISDVAAALAKPGWYGKPDKPYGEWLRVLLMPMTRVGDTGITLAGWKVREIGARDRPWQYMSCIGQVHTDIVAAVFLPAFGACAVLGLGHAQTADDTSQITKALAKTLLDSMAANPGSQTEREAALAPPVHMPAKSTEARSLDGRVDHLLESGGTFAEMHPDLKQMFGADGKTTYYSVTNQSYTMQVVFEPRTPPHDRARHVLVLHGPRHRHPQRYLLVWDGSVMPPVLGMAAAVVRGAFMALDPLTHAPVDMLLFQRVHGSAHHDGAPAPATETMVGFGGKLYARREVVEQLEAVFDRGSQRYHARSLKRTTATTATVASAKPPKAGRRRRQTADDESSGSDSDSDDDSDGSSPRSVSSRGPTALLDVLYHPDNHWQPAASRGHVQRPHNLGHWHESWLHSAYARAMWFLFGYGGEPSYEHYPHDAPSAALWI